MQSIWSHLESIPGLTAVPSVWRARLGDAFEAFSLLCFQTGAAPANSIPCPFLPSCAHAVIIQPASESSSSSSSSSSSISAHQSINPPIQHSISFIGVCEAQPPNCPNTQLTLADLTPLEVNWPRLGRAISKAFDLDPKSAALGIPNTIQFASYSADAVPVLLTIQTDRHVFRRVIAELVARLNAPFILFAPTSHQLDAHSQELLARVKAGFFPLETTVILTTHGTLQPRTPPGELFARFRPEPKDPLPEDAARRAFALLQQLDSQGPKNPPSVLTVFRLYCIEEMSIPQIAARCSCSVGTVANRLKMIETKTGRHPEQLRTFSAHLRKIEDDLADPRAQHIYRKGLTGEHETDDRE